MLEAISRERETELGRIEKDRELEVKKREIAEVVRGRIAVDKTVAEEEEVEVGVGAAQRKARA